MAALSHLTPQRFSLSSFHCHQPCSISLLFYRSCFHLIPQRLDFAVKHSIVYCASTKKSRKLMSDADLCNIIREFVTSVGRPEGHVPSTKELSEHGRKELANIVRRRGHKFIKELLANSSETAIDGSDLQNNLDGEQNEIILKKQEGKVNDRNEKSADILLVNSGCTGNSLVTEHESAINSDDHSERPAELPPYSHEKVNDTIAESDDVP